MRVVRGCWRPTSVEGDVESVTVSRTVKVRCTLLWCCCSLPLMVPGRRPVVLGVGVKTGRRRSQQRRSGCMVLLDSRLSPLGLCQVLSLLRAEAWLVVASLVTAGTSRKLEAEHQPARATITGMQLVPVQVYPRRTAPGSEGVGVVDKWHLLPLQTARSDALETWTVFVSRTMGGTKEDTSTAASGKTCFSFLMSCLHKHSVSMANLLVLTPIWIIARITSLFLGMLASQ